ncbi:heat stress transcription factor A-6b [Benincasa hispida]|uniref:heat stress transcription factor A-6b n=1 Tax=Benincasa hispida TaxID=102211 RepID=UPI0019020EB7|nr:heat stress transcription factor A-6b [Benincasa hispida]
MNRLRRVKEEVPTSSSSAAPKTTTASPQPMEGLNEAGPAPFLTKTYEIIEDTGTNHIVSWSRGNNSFVVWDPQSFSLTLLPKYFKHSNFSSFVRQLNTYGFRKVDPDKWEFAHEGFLRGQKHLLKLIRRRKTTQPNASQQAPDPCVEVGRFGLDREVDRLQRDKQVLMAEVVKLRQQQQNTKTYLQTMERRLKKTETRQQLMMNFLARAIQNPDFIQQLIHQKDKHKELEEAINRKRRRHIDQGQPDFEDEDKEDHILPPFVNDDIHMDVDLLTIDEQHQMKYHVPKEEIMDDNNCERNDNDDDLNEGFWENLLNEANEEDRYGFRTHGFEEQEDYKDEDHGNNELVDHFAFFTSKFQ